MADYVTPKNPPFAIFELNASRIPGWGAMAYDIT